MLTPVDSSVLERLANMTETEVISKKKFSNNDSKVQRQLEFSLLTPERQASEPINRSGRTRFRSSSEAMGTDEQAKISLTDPPHWNRCVRPSISSSDSDQAPNRKAGKARKSSRRYARADQQLVSGAETSTAADALVVMSKSRWASVRALLSRLPRASEEQTQPGDFRSLIDESPRHIVRRPFEASNPHWEILRLKEALAQERERAQQQEAFAASEHAERCATEMAYYRIFQECNNLRQNVNHLEQALQTLRIDLNECLNDLAKGRESNGAPLEHRLREMQDIAHVATYAIRNETAYVRQPLLITEQCMPSNVLNGGESSASTHAEGSPQNNVHWDTWWPVQDSRSDGMIPSMRHSVERVDEDIDRASPEPTRRSLASEESKHKSRHQHTRHAMLASSPLQQGSPASHQETETCPTSFLVASSEMKQKQRQIAPMLSRNEEPSREQRGMPMPDLLLYGNNPKADHSQTRQESDRDGTEESHGLLASLDAC
ncbi:hypothetical protein F1559_004162 [Cyanidiococcus yangmingshanensis]|uniref:Uncharacterized protein n=1 Tax=Cyanidiococcus yangmingshanensis TaxID=2690220 RepID=A0A7J7IKK7_9RHOD|nr:hypothetical protein F1559_004162 [Cyanidiococcus yangmingshanensis]